MFANVGACDGRGLGGLSNAAKRNAKADQLYRVPRDNAHKDNGSYEDTEPRLAQALCWVPLPVNSPFFLVGGIKHLSRLHKTSLSLMSTV